MSEEMKVRAGEKVSVEIASKQLIRQINLEAKLIGKASSVLPY